MHVIYRASLTQFDRKKEFCQNRIKDFSIHHKGASKRINYTKSDNRLEFFNTYTPGIFLCNMVKKNIRDYIKINGQPKPTSYYDKGYALKRFNLKLIEENVNMPMYGIDCDYFYFAIAFQLGIINERTLKKALEKKEEYKQARMAAIGSLNSRTWVEIFENGVKVRDEYDVENYNIYHPFYWMIIKKAYELMEEAFERFPKVACMWLTDCVYTTVAGKKQLEAFFIEKGFEYKYFAMDFLNIDYDSNRVHWHDCKSRSDKNIRFSKYDLTDEVR